MKNQFKIAFRNLNKSAFTLEQQIVYGNQPDWLNHCICNCNAHRLIRNEQMARELCQQNRTQLVDFRTGRYTGIGNCVANSFVSVVESGNKKILLKA